MTNNSSKQIYLKKIVYIFLFLLFNLSFINPIFEKPKQNLSPGVYLYKFTNYRGQVYHITRNDAQIPFNDYIDTKVGYVRFDNAISSIRLVGVSSVAVYTEANYRGNCETITQDTPNLNRTSIGNNTISSVKVNSKCLPSGPSVTLYDKKDFKGRSLVITGNVPDLGVSNFRNRVASFKFHATRSIAVFNRNHYQGKCQTFRGSHPSLAGTEIGLNSIVSIKLNSECAQHRKLTIKNRSGLLIQVFFPREYNSQLWGTYDRGERGRKEIASYSSKQYFIEPETQLKFYIKALFPLGDLAPFPEWKVVCRFDFLMRNDFTITVRGSYFKEMRCEKIIN